MSQDFYDLMALGKPFDEFERALSEAPLEDRKRFASNVDEDKFPWVMSFASKNMEATGVRKALIDGAILYALSLIENSAERRELIDAFLEEQELTKSEAHRSSQSWQVFGPILKAEPTLVKQFSRASLATLAQTQTPTEAREEAMTLARNGERIKKTDAEALQRKHGVASVPPALPAPEAPSPKPSRKRSSKSKGWTFSGAAVRIELKPTMGAEVPDLPTVINDLLAVIDQLRSGQSSLVA